MEYLGLTTGDNPLVSKTAVESIATTKANAAISAALESGGTLQAKINASGVLVGDGQGGVSAAVSGTDLKTINGNSIIGGGNIEVSVDVSGKEDKSNKVSSISSESTDTQYPSAKCVYDKIETLEPKPTIVTGTLTAGQTSVTLSNSALTSDSIVDIYTSIYGKSPSTVLVNTSSSPSSITLTFAEALDSDLGIRVEVKE